MKKEHLAPAIGRLGRWLAPARVGRFPRWAIRRPLLFRLVGVFCIPLALAVLLPIPFGNMPPAFAISLCALGVLRKDGRWIAAGLVIGVASLALVWAVVEVLAGALLGALARSLM